MDTRTIELDPKNLEGGIEALSSAAQAFQLTPFERFSYRALIVSVDVAMASLVALITILIADPDNAPVVGVICIVFAVCVLVATVFLVLNTPLFRKAFRERAKLKELGLASLSESLWKESRRSRWIRRARGALFIMTAIFCLLAGGFAAVYLMTTEEVDWATMLGGRFIALFFVNIGALLFAARYLRNQRERMDLAGSALELKKALQRLQQRAGQAEVVSVPSELLEQAARIESAQIAKERNDAVLRSVVVRPRGYAITFDRDAAEQRAALDVGDRVEFEDLVAQLSIEGPGKLKSQAGAVAGAEGATLRAMTKSQRIEIVYVIDRTSNGIRIIAVRRTKETAPIAP
jgi:hypothetical protein